MTTPQHLPENTAPESAPAPTKTAVETEDLGKSYGHRTALAGIDLVVPEGSVYLLVGPNGAGKTTTLRILQDLARPSYGRVRVLGKDPATEPGRIRSQVGYVPERFDVGFPWMSVARLLQHHSIYYPNWDSGYASELCRRLEVQPLERFGTLSKGQARRVQLVLALAHRPRLLILDEPTDGLDPLGREMLLNLLFDHLAETPATLIVSTHLIHFFERFADQLGVIQGGRLKHQGDWETLRSRLLRYHIKTSTEWQPPDGLMAAHRPTAETIGETRAWAFWGSRQEVENRLRGSGATLQSVDAFSMEEAVLILLSDDMGKRQ